MQIPQMMMLFAQPVPTYTVVLGAAVTALIAWAVASTPVGSRRATFDLCLVMLAAALVLGRIEHVALRWDYYADHLDQVLDMRRGGLGWHGALFGAWLAMAARMKGLPFAPLVFALPVITAAAWVGCAAAGCAYGAEIGTLADAAPGMAAELRDVYGIIAPRWNTPLFGFILAGGLAMVAAAPLLVWRRAGGDMAGGDMAGGDMAPPLRDGGGGGHAGGDTAGGDMPPPLRDGGGSGAHPGRRAFFLAVAVLASGMFVIGYARGDAVATLGGLRADQALDVATLVAAVTMVIVRRRGFG